MPQWRLRVRNPAGSASTLLGPTFEFHVNLIGEIRIDCCAVMAFRVLRRLCNRLFGTSLNVMPAHDFVSDALGFTRHPRIPPWCCSVAMILFGEKEALSTSGSLDRASLHVRCGRSSSPGYPPENTTAKKRKLLKIAHFFGKKGLHEGYLADACTPLQRALP
jgi:hypothetical protein